MRPQGVPNQSERVLNLARMARRLGVSQSWLKGEAAARRVPSLRAGTRFLFEPEAVEKALASLAGGDASS
jgi:hypothetical protein